MGLFEVEVHGTYEVKADSPEDARQMVIDRVTVNDAEVSVNTLGVGVISAEED